ncbi:acyltransferase [Limnobaculum xujianqingii]|uniref:acyltransferase n=1 Tax=Limnobaculum xujianqingii TaxID=2738837 RepID=UPI001E3C4F6A|nr:acyltransferase [Limnobaculum xujianqingii]
MHNERPLILFIRMLWYPYRRIRNLFYQKAFNTKKLCVGDNSILRGTQNIFIGYNVNLGNQTWIDAINSGEIRIGNNVSFSQNVHVASVCKVIIGDGCLIGSDVLITDHDHSFDHNELSVLPKERPLIVKGETILGKNIWLGDNAKILSGVNLGDNVIVAANSVVTKSFPTNTVLAGAPAKIIRHIP